MNFLDNLKKKFVQSSPHKPYFERVLTGDFLEEYDKAESETGTKPSVWRRERFYNLLSALRATKNVSGDIVELGCYKGLSSLLMCQELKKEQSNFRGDNYHIFDSFAGLQTQYPGLFAATEDHVRKMLREYPNINYHPGWIPESFKGLKETTYRFVHVDVDTPAPTVASLAYFYPRLNPGGLVICDDYASPIWDGLKSAVDHWLDENNVKSIPLSTCQLLILKD